MLLGYVAGAIYPFLYRLPDILLYVTPTNSGNEMIRLLVWLGLLCFASAASVVLNSRAIRRKLLASLDAGLQRPLE
ncbi:MAG TPA: hypothetical protein VHL11_07145, partial [Phototrophicaceae bacterium]|jgi:hypothetical protein|nr:hypothetical protein [Phototrophicaceae bacterium]